MTQKLGLLLLNMGGPDSTEAIKPFLKNLFRDPAIAPFPFFQQTFAWMVANLAAPKSTAHYQLIGGYSPLRKISESQASLLEKELRGRDREATVLPVMRYWHPDTEAAVEKLMQADVEEVVVVSMYPHFSEATTGSSIKELKRVMAKRNYQPTIQWIDSWYDYPCYLDLLASRIKRVLNRQFLLFSAHGLPVSFIEAGDPYQEHIQATVDGVMARLPDCSHRLSFQSKQGRAQWLEPSTENAIRQLGREGVRSLLVVPISFVTDNIETLWEIDIHFRELALREGIETFAQLPLFNDQPDFVSLLADLVTEQIDGLR